MSFQERMNAKWRRELFYLCLLFAGITFIAEVIVYLYYTVTQQLRFSAFGYQLRFIYLPTLIDGSMIGVTAYYLRSDKVSNNVKNIVVSMLLCLLCISMQVIHYTHSPLLALPAIAIFVSVLFANEKLTLGIFGISLGSLFLTYIIAANHLRKDDPRLIVDILVAALIICLVYLISKLFAIYVHEQITYIVDSNEQQKLLLQECNMDALMGIGNRRAMDKRLEAVIKTKQPMGKSMYILLIDVDDFKQVNDIYGHQCGDEVLIVLAGLIRAMTPYERIESYRYGGEEILLLLQNKNDLQAFQCCENLRMTFEKLHYSFEPDRKITFSGGLVVYKYGMSVDDWIQAADEALYFAKGNGKNQIQREASVRGEKVNEYGRG